LLCDAAACGALLLKSMAVWSSRPVFTLGEGTVVLAPDTPEVP
jgi:hypothetical protein